VAYDNLKLYFCIINEISLIAERNLKAVILAF